MRVPLISAWLTGLCLSLIAAPAAAWVETRLLADEVRVEVDRAASAVIEHRITMRVHGGPLQSFDLASADKDVTPLESSASPAEGSSPASVPLEIVPRAAGGLRVNVLGPRGLSRGTFFPRPPPHRVPPPYRAATMAIRSTRATAPSSPRSSAPPTTTKCFSFVPTSRARRR